MSGAPPEGAAGRQWFLESFAVSRETADRFDRYAALLAEWQTRFNLVGPATLPHIWTRHFGDSAQLVQLIPPAAHRLRWLDIGSGAGFPALVVALLRPDIDFLLVDSVGKKCRFLETAIAELGIGHASVHNGRIETLSIQKVDVISARACAPLAKLFDWGLPYQAKSCVWLLPKGEKAADEVAEARKRYDFDLELIPSLTDSRARIVKASHVRGKRR